MRGLRRSAEGVERLGEAIRVGLERELGERAPVRIATDMSALRALPWVDSTRVVDDTRAFIRRAIEQHARNEGFHVGVFEGGRIVGGVGRSNLTMEMATFAFDESTR